MAIKLIKKKILLLKICLQKNINKKLLNLKRVKEVLKEKKVKFKFLHQFAVLL